MVDMGQSHTHTRPTDQNIPGHGVAKQGGGGGGSCTVAEGGAPSIKMHVQGDFRAIPPRQRIHVRGSGRVQEVLHKPDFVLGRHRQVLSGCRTFRGIVEFGLEDAIRRNIKHLGHVILKATHQISNGG